MAQETINNGETGLVVRNKINNNFTDVFTPILSATSEFNGGTTTTTVGQNQLVKRDANGDCKMRRLVLGAANSSGLQYANDARLTIRALGDALGTESSPALLILRNPTLNEAETDYDWGVYCNFSASTEGNIKGSIKITSTGVLAYQVISDYRVKENITPINNALAKVESLKTYEFNFVSDPKKSKVTGFLAHEIQEIIPESASGRKDQVDAEGNPVFQGIDQSKVVPLLTAAVQELSQKLDAALLRIDSLENN